MRTSHSLDLTFPIEREVPQSLGASAPGVTNTFCHSFDLTKKLAPGDIKGQIGFHPSMTPPSLSPQPDGSSSPFKLFIRELGAKLENSPSTWIHRVMVPNLLSPTLYSGLQCRPEEVLQFLHSLRALLRQYSGQLTAVITLPLSLYPRSSGLTRWMELLCDGVLELVPLQLNAVHAPPPSGKTDTKSDEQTQGLLRVHSLPIYHEKGGGGSDGHAREDLSFSLSRSKGFIIKPFSLPPVLDDEPEKSSGDSTKTNIEF